MLNKKQNLIMVFPRKAKTFNGRWWVSSRSSRLKL